MNKYVLVFNGDAYEVAHIYGELQYILMYRNCSDCVARSVDFQDLPNQVQNKITDELKLYRHETYNGDNS